MNFTQSHDGKTSSVESIVAAPLPGDDDGGAPAAGRAVAQLLNLRHHPSECGPLGAYLGILGVQRIDLGSSTSKAPSTRCCSCPRTSRSASSSSRCAATAAPSSQALLSRGLHFVGTLYARGTVATVIADDVYCNFTHMERLNSRGAMRPRE